MTKPYRYIIIPGLTLLVAWALGAAMLQTHAESKREREEFIAFVQAASMAAREGDIAIMRRLLLEDALLPDAALKQVFADFARLGDADIDKLSPEFDGDTYCWLRLPGQRLMRKLVRSPGGWFIHGDVVPVDAR